MCRPEHFAVSYAINPWMDPQSWARDARARAAAAHEWDGLHRKLGELGATIDLVPAASGLPDLVFTANAAVVLDRKVLLARFRHPERQGEEPHFEAAFRSLRGARPDRCACASCRTASCSKAPATASSSHAQPVLAGLRPALGRAARQRPVEDMFAPGGRRARTRRPALLPHGHGALGAAGRRGHVSARGVHAGRPG